MIDIPCCNEWTEAQVSGTGSEMYGSLLVKINDEWRVGCDLRPVAFCPWCGSPKSPTHPLVAAARLAVDALDCHGSWDSLKDAIGNLATELEKLK